MDALRRPDASPPPETTPEVDDSLAVLIPFFPDREQGERASARGGRHVSDTCGSRCRGENRLRISFLFAGRGSGIRE